MDAWVEEVQMEITGTVEWWAESRYGMCEFRTPDEDLFYRDEMARAERYWRLSNEEKPWKSR